MVMAQVKKEVEAMGKVKVSSSRQSDGLGASTTLATIGVYK
jgi:hypothetical protein